MKVLVTGYAGFIGRHLTRRLLDEGHSVIGIDDYSNSNDDFTPLLSQRAKFRNYEVDIDQIDDTWYQSEFRDVDCIFHLAAKARVQPSFENPVAWHQTNVTGTLKLLEFARVNNIKKFIFSSSSSVYGLSTKYGQSEHSQLFPLSPYALQKMQAEQLCEFYTALHGIETVCLRYFNVYGENQPTTGNYPQLIPILIDRYESGLPFRIYGDGEQRRDFTYVGDVVAANLKSIKKGISGTFNIGTGVNYSVNEICNMIDPNHPKKYLDARKEPKTTLAINYKAKTVLQWQPTMNLENWIRSRISRHI